MENNNTYFILQHNKNTKMLRASFQTRQNKKTHKNSVATSHVVRKTRKKK